MHDNFLRARSLDMAVLSVGDLSPHSDSREYGLFSGGELTSWDRAGAIGDVLYHFVDAEGYIVDYPLNRRVVADSPLDLWGRRDIILAFGRGGTSLASFRRDILRVAQFFAEPCAEDVGHHPIGLMAQDQLQKSDRERRVHLGVFLE